MPYTVLNEPHNKKLGNLPSLSRPVGPTCPSACPFLGHGCYAERIQARRPSVARNWASRAYGLSPAEWRKWSVALLADLRRADKRGARAVRLHVAGDWLLPDGAVDRYYLAAVLRAFRAARRAGLRVRAYFYTHAATAMAPHRRFLDRVGVQGFASVHTGPEATLALSQGWRLALDNPLPIRDAVPGFVQIQGQRALVCPEQAKGVTCDRCGFCFRAGETRNVTFLRH